jgi:hypothetical protein
MGIGILKVNRRIEKLEKSLSHRALHINTTIYFIDPDGVVKSMLRLSEGKREWIRGEVEVARAE